MSSAIWNSANPSFLTPFCLAFVKMMSESIEVNFFEDTLHSLSILVKRAESISECTFCPIPNEQNLAQRGARRAAR